MSGTPAGWYRDPQDPRLLRWFDGARWTQHVQPAPVPQPQRPASLQPRTVHPQPAPPPIRPAQHHPAVAPWQARPPHAPVHAPAAQAAPRKGRRGLVIGLQAIAADAGLEAVYVSGDLVDGGAHAWNKVKVDGAWKAVDVTWNDSPAGNAYLMIQDSQFTDSATRTEDEWWTLDTLVPQYATS